MLEMQEMEEITLVVAVAVEVKNLALVVMVVQE